MWNSRAVPESNTDALAPLSSENTRGAEPPMRTRSDTSLPLSVNGTTATGRGTTGDGASAIASTVQAIMRVSPKSTNVNVRSHLSKPAKKPSRTGVRPTHQDRSARTRAGLLAAARDTIVRHGWEGATIAAVAERAGVAVGSVYRRFADKDALFAEAYEEFYAASYQRRSLRLESARGMRSFRSAARFVLSDLVARTREHAPFLRPHWSTGWPLNPALRKRIDTANSAGFEQITDFLTARAGPNGRAAVRFALQCAAHAIRGRFLYAAAQPLDVPLTDDEFTEQITEMVAAFVRSATPRSAR